MNGRSAPRLPPLPPGVWDDETVAAVAAAFSEEAVEGFRTAGAPTVLATMAHHPALAGPFLAYGNVLLQRPALGHRARELMILRVAWRTRSRYEWVHHVHLAPYFEIDAADLSAVAQGGTAERWTAVERDLVRATDEMLDHYRIDDETWARLTEHLDERQLVEVPFVVGTYACLAMAFNSWEMKLEEDVDTNDVPRLPELS